MYNSFSSLSHTVISNMKKQSKQTKSLPIYSSLCSFSSFWENSAVNGAKSSNGSITPSKSRFSMLLLEFGEYFLEDFSCDFILSISSLSDTSFNRTETVRGRLKLCSRCLVFDPCDAADSSISRRRPLLKFPYRNMTSSIQEVALQSTGFSPISGDIPRMFSFTCTCYWEMMTDDKIGPYKLVEFNNTINGSSNGCPPEGRRFVMSLLHSDLAQFITKANQLRYIFTESKDGLYNLGTGKDSRLQPFIDSALRSSLQFNASNMVDFHEQLLFSQPIAVNRIGPLTSSPGGLMLTDKRVYFQPSQINNTGASIGVGVDGSSSSGGQHFPLAQVQRIFRRRYLLRQTALEFLLTSSQRFLFVFASTAERDHIFALTIAQLPASATLTSTAALLELMMQLWQRREISNFDYLMFLNNEADRSCNDLTQYPASYPLHLVLHYLICPTICYTSGIPAYTSRFRVAQTGPDISKNFSRFVQAGRCPEPGAAEVLQGQVPLHVQGSCCWWASSLPLWHPLLVGKFLYPKCFCSLHVYRHPIVSRAMCCIIWFGWLQSTCCVCKTASLTPQTVCSTL